MPKAMNLVGQRFGRLVVVERAQNNVCGHTFWKCLCDCGNETIVRGTTLTAGKTQSCGCITSERMKAGNPKHGYRYTRMYSIWASMLKRCNNPNCKSYPNYGGRGIKVCKEWYDPKCFCEWALSNGYNDDLSIDRIDVNSDYCSENCRWVTRTVQARNRRKFKNKELPVGVSISPNGKYSAHITAGYKMRHLGTYDTAEEAAEAYRRAKTERDNEQG